MKKIRNISTSVILALALLANQFTFAAYAEEMQESEVVTEGVYTYDVFDQTETYSEISYNVAPVDSNDLTEEIYQATAERASVIDSEESSIEETVSDDMIDPQEVVGTDDRIKISRPDLSGRYKNTCSLEISMPNGKTYIGTGFILSNSAVATAGHCVYDSSTGGWATSIKIFPAKHGTVNPFGYATSTGLSCGAAWKNSGDVSQDWGLIRVSESSHLCDKCGCLGLRWQSGTYVNDHVSIAGYPFEAKSTTPNGEYMYKHSGKITSNTSSVLTYKDIDTSGGESGAPVVEYYEDTGYTSIGIHRGLINDKNSAVRISEWLFNYFVDNS